MTKTNYNEDITAGIIQLLANVFKTCRNLL